LGDIPYWGANSIVGYVDEALFDEDLVLLGEDGAPFFEPSKPVAFFSQGKVWPNNHVHVLRPTVRGTGTFITHVLNVTDYAQFIDGSTRDKLTQGSMNDIPIPWPPPTEQTQIATFLDRETAKIDELVAEQRRLMELLKEKRQAVISHAVTQGLNPHAPMKPSGIEWLGDVPAHWTCTALKRVVSVCGRIGFRGYTTEDLVAEGEGALALGGANLTVTGQIDLTKRTYISWPKYEESPEIQVAVNDLIIGQRGTCGKVVLMDREIGPSTINPSLVLLKQPKLDSRFLCYWLMGDLVQSLFDSYLNATAIPMLSQQQIGSVPVCHPSLEEQIAIAIHVEQEVGKLDTLTTEAQRAIDLLQERRTALISAAVTGQIDVRGLAPA
jgi:type I restriction enzyme S subunit